MRLQECQHFEKSQLRATGCLYKPFARWPWWTVHRASASGKPWNFVLKQIHGFHIEKWKYPRILSHYFSRLDELSESHPSYLSWIWRKLIDAPQCDKSNATSSKEVPIAGLSIDGDFTQWRLFGIIFSQIRHEKNIEVGARGSRIFQNLWIRLSLVFILTNIGPWGLILSIHGSCYIFSTGHSWSSNFAWWPRKKL